MRSVSVCSHARNSSRNSSLTALAMMMQGILVMGKLRMCVQKEGRPTSFCTYVDLWR